MRDFALRALVASTILFGVALLILGLYALRIVLVVVFLAIVLAAAIRPLALSLQRKARVGLPVAVIVVYLTLALAALTAVTLVVPLFLADLLQFGSALPEYLSQIVLSVARAANLLGQGGEITAEPGQIQTITEFGLPALAGLLVLPLSVITVLAWTISVFALAFYWLLERDVVLWRVAALTPPAQRRHVYQIWIAVERKLGAYVLGQVIVSMTIGLLTLAGLLALGIRYALVLALIAGITEWIPIIGPFLAGIPATLIAFFQSPWLALAVVVLFVVIQQVEGNLIYPKIQEKISKVSAFWLLLAIIAGTELMGIVGALIAVPVAVTFSVILEEIAASVTDTPAATSDGGQRAA